MNLTLTDQTAEIAKGFAKSAGTFTVFLDGQDERISYRFDPNDPASLSAAKQWFAAQSVTLTCISGCDVPLPTALPKETDRLLYRAPLPVVLSLSKSDGSVDRFDVRSLNASPILGIPAERSTAVERKLVLVFEDGVPKEVTHEKPSEVAALATLPADVIGAYLNGIVGGITGRNSVVQQRKTLLESEAALLNAQAAYLEAQKSYGERVDALENTEASPVPQTGDPGPGN